MKIEFKRTPEQVALVKAMASNSKIEAGEAQEAFAAFLSPVLQEVLMHVGSATNIFTDEPYDEDDSPSFPIDTLYGQGYGDISIWSQTVGGGLPTNELAGASEIKLRTYDLDSAISFDKRYARRARLNVVARYMEFFANQLLVKQERNAWAVIMKVLADATTRNVNHVFRAGTAGSFVPNDISNLWTLIRRFNTDYLGGSPAIGESAGLTDLYVSPEIKGQIRGFAYNPVNTKAGVVTGGAGVTSVTLPEDVRSQIYKSAGTSEIFGVMIHELLELGESRRYNDLFDFFAGSKNYDVFGGTSGSAFDSATDELLVGIDSARNAFIRPVETHDENGGQIQTFVDDQFQARAQKIGWYSKLREGRVVLDARASCGIIV
jgi:hypothetical protein